MYAGDVWQAHLSVSAERSIKVPSAENQELLEVHSLNVEQTRKYFNLIYLNLLLDSTVTIYLHLLLDTTITIYLHLLLDTTIIISLHLLLDITIIIYLHLLSDTTIIISDLPGHSASLVPILFRHQMRCDTNNKSCSLVLDTLCFALV